MYQKYSLMTLPKASAFAPSPAAVDVRELIIVVNRKFIGKKNKVLFCLEFSTLDFSFFHILNHYFLWFNGNYPLIFKNCIRYPPVCSVLPPGWRSE